MSRTLIVLLILAAVLAGCGGKNEQSGRPAETATAGPAHAAAGAVPGSYEDWCGEHQVPESVCSRCDPSLIPAFQATNDWCAEHGLPESQCLVCHPDLKIVRPPQPEGR
jgi:hypothetical protein